MGEGEEVTEELEKIKAYLRRVKLLEDRIKTMQGDLDWLNESLLRITPTLKEDVVSFSGSQDKLGDTVAKIADLQAEINCAIDALVDEKARIIQQLNRVEDHRYFTFLHKRFLEYKTIEDIAREMCYSERWIGKIQNQALLAFKEAQGQGWEADDV